MNDWQLAHIHSLQRCHDKNFTRQLFSFRDELLFLKKERQAFIRPNNNRGALSFDLGLLGVVRIMLGRGIC